jgi:hypothetical protein
VRRVRNAQPYAYVPVTIDFRRVWRVLTVFEDFDYFSVDRGTEPMGSEFSLAIGWVGRERDGRSPPSLELKSRGLKAPGD